MWKQVLAKNLPEHERLLAGGATFAAAWRLGAVLAVAVPAERSEAKAAVDEHMGVVDRAVLLSEAAAVRARVLHILSIGSSFNFDEILLVLTLRMELELAALVAGHREGDGMAFDLAALDVELAEVARSKENRGRFASALAKMRKNWEIPIPDLWAGSGN